MRDADRPLPPSERAGRRISEIYQRVHAVVEDIVAEGKRKGELDPQLPTREFATMVVATHDGMMLEWYRRGGGIDGRIFVRTVWQTFLNGILPREAERRRDRSHSFLHGEARAPAEQALRPAVGDPAILGVEGAGLRREPCLLERPQRGRVHAEQAAGLRAQAALAWLLPILRGAIAVMWSGSRSRSGCSTISRSSS